MTMKLLNVPEIAERLQCSPQLVRLMMHRGELPVLKVGKKMMLPEDTLEQWIRNQVGTSGKG